MWMNFFRTVPVASTVLALVAVLGILAVAGRDVSGQFSYDGSILVSNLETTKDINDTVLWRALNMVAVQFTTGSDAELSSVVLKINHGRVMNKTQSVPEGMRVSIWSSSAAADSIPDTELGVFTNPVFPVVPISSEFNPVVMDTYERFVLADPIDLVVATTYFLVIESSPMDVRIFMGSGASYFGEDASGIDGWTIADATIWKPKADAWSMTRNPYAYVFALQLEGVEPTVPAANFVNNLSVVGNIHHRAFSQRTIGNHPNSYSSPTSIVSADRQGAVAFTTGTGSNNYTITAVKAQLAGTSGTTYTPVVTLHADNSGVPADAALFTFTNPDPLPTLTGFYEDMTFTAGEGYEVERGTTYHIRFDDAVADAAAFEYYSVEMTSSDSEDALTDPDDMTSGSGWEIADSSNVRTGTSGTWAPATDTTVYRIGIEGVFAPGVTVDTDPGTDGPQSDKLTIVEGMTDTYTVALDTAPSRDVTVTPTAPAGLSVSPAVLTFSATDFGAKTFTITADADNDLEDAAGLEITHAVTGYGEVMTADPVTVDVTDDDEAGITVTPTMLTVNEGGMGTYTVVLDFQPADSVTVTPSVTSGRGLTLSESSLTFSTSDWDNPQPVTVTAAEDTNNASETATITHTAAESGTGMDYDLAETDIDDISVTVNDNDQFMLSRSSLTIAEGATDTYTMVIARTPSSTVTVDLVLSSDIGLTADTDTMVSGNQLSLEFTVDNWSTPQTVQVMAPEDADGFANTGTITHTVSGGGLTGIASLTTTVTEDEEVGVVLGGSATYNTTEDDYAMTINEGTARGSSNMYTVKLASQPYPTSEDVTVTITAPAGLVRVRKVGANVGSKTAYLTFTSSNWDTEQTVTLTSGHDSDVADNTGISVSHVATGANFDGAEKSTRTLNVTVNDDDSAGLRISESSLVISETNTVATATYYVDLATEPSSDVTVTLTQPTNTDVTIDTNGNVDGLQNTIIITPSEWSTGNPVLVSVAADADAGDETATIVHSVSQAGGDMEYNITDVNVVVRIDDDETVSVTGAVASRSMEEDAGGTDVEENFTLKLGTPPTSPVTITMAVVAVEPAQVEGRPWTDPDITVTQSVVLDASNYAAGKVVTITLSEDDDAEDDVARINYTVTQAGGAMEYDGYRIPDNTTVNISDPETPVVLFRDITNTDFNADIVDWEMDDGGDETLFMRLSHRPRGAVTVSVSLPQGSGLSVDNMMTESFTETSFGNLHTQDFTFTHELDDDAYSQVYTLVFSVSGYGSGTVNDLNITVVDKDEVGLDIDMPAITVEEGASGSYTISALSRPSTSTGDPGTVSVAITSNNADVTVSPNPVVLNSNNWAAGVDVTVSTRQDADGVNDVVTLSHVATSVSGGQAGDYDGAGGPMEAASIKDVTVTVTDDDDNEIVFEDTTVSAGEHSVSMSERETKVFKVKLATEPTDAVTVTINDPADNSEVTTEPSTLTFNSGNYATGQNVTVRAGADNDTVDDVGTITFAVAQSGGQSEYDGITVSEVTANVADPDRSEVTVNPVLALLTVLEEGTATYHVRVSHQPASGDTLTVTLSVSGSGTPITFDTDPIMTDDQNTLTYTASDWDTEKPVTVTGVADANLVDEEYRISHVISGVRARTGTNWFMNVTRTDNDRANLDLGTTTALTVAEGGSTSYDIKLTQQPTATVTLTVTAAGNDDVRFSTDSCTTLTTTGTLEFSTTNWDSTQSLTLCGAEDYDATDDTATLTYGASGGGYGSLNYPATGVTVTDDDEETIEISPTAIDITEGDGVVVTGTYNVSLSAAPMGGNVTVAIAVANNTDVTTNPTSLTFSANDWATAGTQTVTKAVEIRVADDAGADDETADITNTQGGADYGDGTALDGVTVTITDSDERMVIITADDPFEFNEGGSKTYQVKLATEPTGPVTVSVDDAVTTDDIRVDKTALEFTIATWNTAQTVTVSAAADEDAQDDTGTIDHGVTGADYETNNVTAASVEVTVNDQNTRSVDLRIGTVENPTSPAFSIGEGTGQVNYNIKLGTKPVNTDGTDGEVTVTVTTSNSSELKIFNVDAGSEVNSYVVTFDATNWNEYQLVVIIAPDEPGDSSQDTAMIMHAVAGADYGAVTARDIAVTINDDDSPSFSTSAEDILITEGTSGAYSVVLNTVPVGGDVTITVTVGSNPDIRLTDENGNPATSVDLAFTTSDWNVGQTVTVQVAEDRDALLDSGTIRHVATGANFGGNAMDVEMRVNVLETTLAGVTIEPTRLSITEGLTGTYSVSLQSEPESNVTVVLSSSNSGKVSVSPGRLTFTKLNATVPQTVTVTGVSDADANNDSSTITHTSSGDIYADVEIASVTVTVVEDGTAVRDTSSFLRSSSCEGEVRLTWNSPTAEGVTIASYQIQWRTGMEQYSASRFVTATADATSYTLSSLTNGVSYTIRVHGANSDGDPVWSRETTATPSAQSCIVEVRFGNILADSTPVIVEVDDADPGTMVNMRYRSLNPGIWSEVQSTAVERGETTVTFDIRGLRPDSDYEVQTWLGNRTPPADNRPESAPRTVAQTIFTTTSLPEGVTFVGGGGGGSIARIGRIEPSIRSVTMSAGDEVALSVEVWGRQGLLDNGLADKAPADGRPVIVWSSGGDGTFEEGRVRSDWRDGIANDRQVMFVASDEPGTVTVTASLVDSADCLAQQEDETSEKHEARCSAQIEVTVVRRATAPIIETAPVNPPGAIPETLSDADGVAYAVLTPVDGGSFAGEGYSLEADTGAVSNGEYIGVSMAPTGDASNVGMTWHRYTLAGQRYAISVVDADGDAVSDYGLNKAVTACVPLPSELRGNIADIVLAAADDAGDTTVLSTSVKITPDGVSVCGKLSTLPATVAVGKVGSPPEVVDPSEDVAEEPLPDTGGAAPATPWLLYLLLAGLFATVAGMTVLRRIRRFGIAGDRIRRR